MTLPASQQRERHYACQEDVGCSYHYIFYNTFRVHFLPPEHHSQVLPWESKDNLAAEQEQEARRKQTKEALCRLFKENMSTNEQAMSPSDMKRQMLLYLIEKEVKKRNKKMKETDHPHDALERDFINIFHFKGLNETSQAVQTQGLLQVYPQSPQQFLTLFKDLQKASLKDITVNDNDIDYCSMINKHTKDQRIKDVLPPPGLREYPPTQCPQSQLQSIPTTRCHKLEKAWVAKINSLSMSQQTPQQIFQSDDECFKDWKVLAPPWESLYRKYFFTGLHHQPKRKQKDSLWPYFPWACSNHRYNHYDFGSYNIVPTRCNK